MIQLCTLFDSNYIDRGIALYQSLEKVSADFLLYIFAFDQAAFEMLTGLGLKHAVVISEEKLLNEELRKIKKERRRAEYYWTCTPVIIEYVMDEYGVEECTYIDSDLYFFADPQPLMDDFHASGAAVSVIGHRFPRNIARKKRENLYGKYCVEFNTFCNNRNGRHALGDWREKCFASCTMDLYAESYGDQKYMSGWKEAYSFVFETCYAGAGVAPWNVADYRLVQRNGSHYQLRYRKNELCELIFYHFQNVDIYSDGTADIGVYNELGNMDDRLIRALYYDYVGRLQAIRSELQKKYGFVIPDREKRAGEDGHEFHGWIDKIVYLWQSVVITCRGKKNHIKVEWK